MDQTQKLIAILHQKWTINWMDQTKKANSNTSPEMKISCNVKQGTSLVKNSSQTLEIKDETNEKSHI